MERRYNRSSYNLLSIISCIIPDTELFADGPGGAHPQDVLHAEEVEQLIAVNADGGHAHAAGHDAHRHALVGAGIALDAADVVDQPPVLQIGLRDELAAQGIAGHQHRFGKIPGGRVDMRCSHVPFLLYILNSFSLNTGVRALSRLQMPFLRASSRMRRRQQAWHMAI